MSTQSTPPLHPKEDYVSICELRKVIHPTGQQLEEIFRLYRKYIQWIPAYTTNCNCSSNIANLWNELNQWVIKNTALFEQ